VTGPISFSHPEARAHLLMHREVFTLRPRGRTTGETWLRYSRTGPKRGDVVVERVVDEPSREDLAQYADRSGLGTPERWRTAAAALHVADSDVLDGLAVFRVELLFGPEDSDESNETEGSV